MYFENVIVSTIPDGRRSTLDGRFEYDVHHDIMVTDFLFSFYVRSVSRVMKREVGPLDEQKRKKISVSGDIHQNSVQKT